MTALLSSVVSEFAAAAAGGDGGCGGCEEINAARALCGVAPDCLESASETSRSAREAHAKGSVALRHTKDVAEMLRGLQDGLGKSDFVAIKETIEQKKARTALGLFKEMDDIAVQMLTRTSHLTSKLNGLLKEVLPESIQEEVLRRDTGITTRERGGIATRSNDEEDTLSVPDEEAQALVELLGNADSQVEQVNHNTRSIMEQPEDDGPKKKGLVGNAYQQLADTIENVALKIFREIQTVSDTTNATLSKATEAAAEQESGSLCSLLVMVAASAANAGEIMEAIYKACRLSKLVQKGIELLRRTLAAFQEFIDTTWSKFQKFVDKFLAPGKKIQQFTNSVVSSLTHSITGRDVPVA